MSLPRNPEKEPDAEQTSPKQRAYFSREMLKREAERLQSRSAQSEVPQQAEPVGQPPEQPQGLDQLSMMVRKLAQETGRSTEESKRDEKVLIMAAAVLEMCRQLQTFSETISGEMKALNEKQQQNLNLQEVYAQSVKTATQEATANIYYNLRTQEKQAVNSLMQYVEANSNQMEKDMLSCAGHVKAAAESAQNATKQIGKSLERFRRIKTIRDLLYYAAPVLVLIDIIIRAADAAAHFL